MRGVYYDGQTAHAHEVDVVVGAEGLTLTGSGIEATWPFASLVRIHQSGRSDRLRLAPNAESQERLVIEGGALADREALEARAPHLFNTRHGHGREAVIVGALAAVAGLIVWFVIFGLPALSGPIARSTPPQWESQLSRTMTQYMSVYVDPCPIDPEAQQILEGLTARLAAPADPAFDIAVEIVDANFPNALALPGGRVMVTDDLLEMMEGPDELAGVLAHEIAHVARRHVMAAILREVGYGIVLEAALGGGSGAGQSLARAGSEAASLGHTREAETEADELAVAYLLAAGIDPGGLADFFDTITALSYDDTDDENQFLALLRTHPYTHERAEIVRASATPGAAPALTEREWEMVKNACSGAGGLMERVRDLLPGSDEEAEAEAAQSPPR